MVGPGHARLHRRARRPWSIPLSTKAIRRSAAPRARPSRSRAPTRAAGAGRAWPRPNAGCTRRDHSRADRARQCGSTVGGQRSRRRAPGGAHASRSRCASCVLRAQLAGLVEVLSECPGEAVVTPLLLADAYHARIDIPRQIAGCSASDRVLASRRARRGRPPGVGAASAGRGVGGFPARRHRRRTRGGDRLIEPGGQRPHRRGGAEIGGRNPMGGCCNGFRHPPGTFAGRRR